jgi:hypothetical protein
MDIAIAQEMTAIMHPSPIIPGFHFNFGQSNDTARKKTRFLIVRKNNHREQQ